MSMNMGSSKMSSMIDQVSQMISSASSLIDQLSHQLSQLERVQGQLIAARTKQMVLDLLPENVCASSSTSESSSEDSLVLPDHLYEDDELLLSLPSPQDIQHQNSGFEAAAEKSDPENPASVEPFRCFFDSHNACCSDPDCDYCPIAYQDHCLEETECVVEELSGLENLASCNNTSSEDPFMRCFLDSQYACYSDSAECYYSPIPYQIHCLEAAECLIHEFSDLASCNTSSVEPCRCVLEFWRKASQDQRDQWKAAAASIEEENLVEETNDSNAEDDCDAESIEDDCDEENLVEETNDANAEDDCDAASIEDENLVEETNDANAEDDCDAASIEEECLVEETNDADDANAEYDCNAASIEIESLVEETNDANAEDDCDAASIQKGNLVEETNDANAEDDCDAASIKEENLVEETYDANAEDDCDAAAIQDENLAEETNDGNPEDEEWELLDAYLSSESEEWERLDEFEWEGEE